jgi:hypothetical protein
MAGKLGRVGPIRRAEGSPEYGEIAEQMTVGTLPTDQGPQGPSLASQGLDLLKQAGKTVYGNLREAVTDPVAFNKRALGNVAQQLQSDPQEFIMNWTGGGLGGVIKPKGGVFPKAQTGSGIDNYLQRVQETLARDAAGDLTIGQIKTINQFIEDKGRKYLTTTYGTGDDVLKEALFQGRMPALGTDKKTFREYMLREARSGNPEALQDFERLYDVRAGINPYVVTPSRYEAAEEIRDTASRQMLEKMKQEGVQEELIEGPEEEEKPHMPEELPNIPGRTYADGEPIPVTLPALYVEAGSTGTGPGQNCGNCGYYAGGMCGKFQAAVRETYWCAKWEDAAEEAEEDAEEEALDMQEDAAEQEYEQFKTEMRTKLRQRLEQLLNSSTTDNGF